MPPLDHLDRLEAEAITIFRECLRPEGKTVLLIAGGGHVLRSLGVPTHWPSKIQSKVVLAQSGPSQAAIKLDDFDAAVENTAIAIKDHCATLRQQWGKGQAGR